MALNKTQLRRDLKNATLTLIGGAAPGLSAEVRRELDNAAKNFSDKLADIIDDYIKSADVTINKGIAVKTTDNPASVRLGETTEEGEGRIS